MEGQRSGKDYKKYYNILDMIGNGAFGCVFKGKEIKTNELRAIKVIKLDKIKENIIINENNDIENKLRIYRWAKTRI